MTVATGPDSRIAGPLAAADIDIETLPLQRAPHPRDLAAMRQLRAVDRRLRPDVVHAHSSKAGALVRAALPRPARLLYTPHCLAFLAREGRARSTAYRAVEQALVPRSAAIIAVSEWEASATRSRLRGATARVRTVHNGVPRTRPQSPDPQLQAFAGDRPLAGLVAVLREQKDPLLLVRAAARMAPDAGRVAIVGDGPLRGAVQGEIERLGIADRVALFGYGGAMGPHLAAIDLLVLPSAWESFPIGVLEAMETGLPVIATAVGGVPEAVIDGLNGRIVPPGDPEQLAAALTAMLGDADLRAAMGADGASRVRERFSLGTMVDAVAALYEERRDRGRA